MKPTDCPQCGKTLDEATCMNATSLTPKPGDFTVCVYCGEILTFTQSLGVARVDVWLAHGLTPSNRKLLLKAQKVIRERKAV